VRSDRRYLVAQTGRRLKYRATDKTIGNDSRLKQLLSQSVNWPCCGWLSAPPMKNNTASAEVTGDGVVPHDLAKTACVIACGNEVYNP